MYFLGRSDAERRFELSLPKSLPPQRLPSTGLDQTPDALVSLCTASLFPRKIHRDSAAACCSNDFLIIFPLSSSLVANVST